MSFLHWYAQLWEINPERAIWIHIVAAIILGAFWANRQTERELDYGPATTPHIHTYDPLHGDIRYNEDAECLECKCSFPDCQKWVRVEDVKQ